jgi:hypothetical protein
MGPGNLPLGIFVFLAISTDIRFAKIILNRLEQVLVYNQHRWLSLFLFFVKGHFHAGILH